jgi:hypothetical protein
MKENADVPEISRAHTHTHTHTHIHLRNLTLGSNAAKGRLYGSCTKDSHDTPPLTHTHTHRHPCENMHYNTLMVLVSLYLPLSSCAERLGREVTKASSRSRGVIACTGLIMGISPASTSAATAIVACTQAQVTTILQSTTRHYRNHGDMTEQLETTEQFVFGANSNRQVLPTLTRINLR